MHQFWDALSAAGRGKENGKKKKKKRTTAIIIKNRSFPPAAKVKICKRKREENGSLDASSPQT